MKRLSRSLFALAAVVALAGIASTQASAPKARIQLRDKSAARVASKAAVSTEAQRQRKELEAYKVGVPFTSMEICAGSPIPAGWIITGGRWNPTTCGNPSTIYDNVLTITQYSTLPVGSSLDVCSGQATPVGWVIVGGRWDPTRCGRPSTIYDNITVIHRAQ